MDEQPLYMTAYYASGGPDNMPYRYIGSSNGNLRNLPHASTKELQHANEHGPNYTYSRELIDVNDDFQSEEYEDQ